MAENNCVVCFKNCRIYSIGECDHPVCYECSTRMRVLCRQNECPMCRHEMGMVVFTERVRPFRRLKKTYAMYDSQHNIAFENSYVRDVYESLLHYVCKKCPRRPIFESFESVNDHMRREHDLYCCDLCAENLKIFPAERRYYTRQELSRHRRIGDIDDRSHRGHPLCEFCDVRYMDRDELYRHLRKEHLFCHICDSEGIQQFYGMYDMLREHYKKDHFLCEEGDCFKEQLTSVFPTDIDLKAHKALVHCKNLRNKQAAKQARTLELEFSLPPRNHSERHRGRTYNQESEDNTCGQDGHSQESTQNIMASWEHDFPSLTNSTSYATAKPKLFRESNKRLTYDQIFPALGSETSVKLNVTNSVDDSHPSTSGSVTSTNISVRVNRQKPKMSVRTNQPQSTSGPSTSTLSLTWVNKAKEKKPAPDRSAQTPSPPDVPVKPPPLSGDNFPTLQKNCSSNNVAESSKKNKKSTLSIRINESDNQCAKVNYSGVIAAKSNPSDAKVNNKKTTSSKPKEKPEPAPQKSNGDNKTHCFLLNANRKKVKMKPETFTTLNYPLSSQITKSATVNSSSSVSDSKERKSDKVDSENKKTNNRSDSAVVKSNKANCDRTNDEEKNKIADKKSQAKEKRENGQRKDKEKRETTQQKSNKENERNTGKNDRGGKEKNSPKQENGMSNNVAKNKNNGQKKTETNDKKKTDQKSHHPKKSELNIEPLSETSSNKNASTSFAANKPPPGLGKPAAPPAPPGFVPLQNGFTNQIFSSKSAVPSFSSLVSDSFFVYQQPDEFVSRNSQLIEKIDNSLVNANEDALNEFKNTSLLFREGYITAANYYLYCLENIKREKFADVFVDLVVLLPNILKQQELWAVHQTTMPSSVETSEVGNCSICFQILKLDDALLHYAKHGLTADSLMHYTGVTK